MDLKAVKTFHRIVALGGFNRAAEELNYAQSTVTMQIQKLEAELGARLIERGKTFELTEAGRLFLEQSAPIVRDIDQLQDTITGLALGETGDVRLGVVEPIASYSIAGHSGRVSAGLPQNSRVRDDRQFSDVMPSSFTAANWIWPYVPRRRSGRICILSRCSRSGSSSCSRKIIRSRTSARSPFPICGNTVCSSPRPTARTAASSRRSCRSRAGIPRIRSRSAACRP